MKQTKLDVTIPNKNQFNSKIKELKLFIINKVYNFKRTIQYTKKEKALIEIQIAKKGMKQILDNGLKAKNSFKHIKDAEQHFLDQEYQKSIDKSRLCLRNIQLNHTRDLDSLYIGRKIRRLHEEIPESENEKKHLVLRVIKEASNNENYITRHRVENVIKEAYGTSRKEGLNDFVDSVLQNHDQIEIRNRLADHRIYQHSDKL